MEFKTNKEIVEAILKVQEESGIKRNSKTALGKMDKATLEQEYLLLLDEVEGAKADVAEEPQEAPETVETVKEDEEPKEEEKPVTESPKAPKKASDIFLKDKVKAVETVIDLDIYRKHFYFARNPEGKVRIENLGFGDVYFGEGDVVHGDKTKRVLKGQSVELDAGQPIALLSSSSPRVKVTEI